MRELRHFLRAFAISVCGALLLSAQARAQDGETFWLEAGKTLPHCEKDSASPLCQVERSLATEFQQPEPHAEPLIVQLINWLLGYEEKGDANIQRPGRNTVVEPVIIDYQLVSLEVLDAADIEALPPWWQEGLAPHVVKPGTLRADISVAFEDAYGMRWPAQGRQSHVYLLREHDDWPFLSIEESSSSREIGPRWASSDCVGSAETPLCAVETFLACRVRNDDALCRDADDTVGRDARWATHVHYDVSAIDAVDDGSLPPGHKYAVTLGEWDRYRGRGIGEEEFVRYLVERSDQGWRVVERSVIEWDSLQHPD